MTVRFCSVKSGLLTCVCVCTCVFSVCILAVCVCCMSAHGKGPHNPCTKCISSCLDLIEFMPPSFLLNHLPHHPFPLHFLLLFKQPVFPNCHHGSQVTSLLRIGWKGGADYIISPIPLMEADLEPRTKARSLLSLARPRTAPQTFYPGLRLTGRKGNVPCL